MKSLITFKYYYIFINIINQFLLLYFPDIKFFILILVKAAVRKFCLFVAISVWKPGIAALCGIIFRAWDCVQARLQRGWI